MKHFLFIFVIISCSAVADEPTRFVGRHGPYKIEQLISPGFHKLSNERKMFAYYLSKAMGISRDIFWHQASREGLAIRDLFVKIWKYSDVLSTTEKSAISEYLFRILMEHRNYDKYTNTKFTPENLTAETFMKIAKATAAKAHTIGQDEDSRFISIESFLLRPIIFDPNYKSVMLASPPQDLASQSNTNFYGDGVTEEHVKILQAEGHIDSVARVFYNDQFQSLRVVRPRISEIANTDSEFGEYLLAADYYLRQALEFATEGEAAFIKAIQHAFRTGVEKDWYEAYSKWLQNKPEDLDFMIGFIEKYEDPMGSRASWESWIMVLTKDPETEKRVEQIRTLAAKFEALMPVDDEFKKTGKFTPPNAEGNDMLFASGRTGEQPFLGKNLFDDPKLKAFGTKGFMNLNLMDHFSTNEQLKQYEVFIAPEYREFLYSQNLNLLKRVQVEFHEILGHGSGQYRTGITGDNLKELYNPLEEARAEVASLYHLLGAEPYTLGVLPGVENRKAFQKMSVAIFFTDHILSFFKMGEKATSFRQAHQWGRQMMMNFLIEQNCLSVKIDGTPHFYVKDLHQCRDALGKLWQQLQFSKSTGDYEMANKLFQTYGQLTTEHLNWRKLIVQEMERQQRPKYRLVLNPKLQLVNGQVQILHHSPSANPIQDFINDQVEEIENMSKEINKIYCESRL